ncbi:MAG: hypothetical protein QW761_02525, partial [Candidatus Aenigmatarchaeota archaeon]
MRGVSALVAVMLLLIISVGLTATTYTWLRNTQTEVTTSIEKQQQIRIQRAGSQLTVISVEPSTTPTINVQNTGKYELTNFVVYVDDYLVTPLSVPTKLAPGEKADIVLQPLSPGMHTVKITTNLASAATSIE